jgi:endonuclease/exonuclease/phosphatase family metal-dependent hydrolase
MWNRAQPATAIQFAAGVNVVKLVLLVACSLVSACNAEGATLLVNVLKTFPVRSVNTHGDAGNYSVRLRAIADEFAADSQNFVGLIAMQEVKEDMENCHVNRGWEDPPAHGSWCLALLLEERHMPEIVYHAYRSRLGIVVGKPWRWLETNYWTIGSDASFLDPFLDYRHLLEVRVENTITGHQLRFYSTHLSHDTKADDDTVTTSRVVNRAEQVSEIREIIRGRASPGELPPVIAGDFNFGPDDGVNEAAMMDDFENRYQSRVDIIWTGKPEVFSSVGRLEDAGSGANATLDFRTPRTVSYQFDGARFFSGSLSDHDSPRTFLRAP